MKIRTYAIFVGMTAVTLLFSSCQTPTRAWSWQTKPMTWNPQPQVTQPQWVAPVTAPEPPPRTYTQPIKQRSTCSKCCGSGVEAAVDMNSMIPTTQTCSRCKGKGYFETY